MFLMLPLLSMGEGLDYSKRQVSQFQVAIDALENLSVETLTLNSVPFCMRYTCREIISVKIPELEWNAATEVLTEKPISAEMERAILAEVVSHIEVLIGRVTNTQYDIGGTFRAKSIKNLNSMQLDCIDEAFNMYVYLNLLNSEGKLHWHSISEVVHRGWLVDLSYPHTALSIAELATRDRFVIDSWFHDNGRPPELIPLPVWKAGWTPEDFK
jgi:hypothetical protein